MRSVVLRPLNEVNLSYFSAPSFVFVFFLFFFFFFENFMIISWFDQREENLWKQSIAM
jgi:hypothetical protein